MRVLRRSAGDTLAVFGRGWKSILFALLLLIVGNGLGFLCLGYEKAMDELRILALYTFGPIGILVSIVFLWNMWLAPYRLMEDKLDEVASNVHSPGAVAKVPEAPDLGRWKRVTVLKLYQVAELCGGISPGVVAAIERSNDASRAIYSELEAALISDDLKGSDEWANEYTRIKRKDLQNYFSGRDDFPEFLKD